jgi:flagellar motor switch protein FliM
VAMDKILSQDEMDALLKNAGDPKEATTGKVDGEASSRRITVYDFRRPDRVPKSALQTLQLLHDRFCTNVSASLSAYLRTVTAVSLQYVDQANLSEFLLSMPDPTCVIALNMRPLSGMAVLELSLDLVFPLIDRLLGGDGLVQDSNRRMTEIEKNVIQEVVQIIVKDLVTTWRSLTEANFQVQSSETRAQLLKVATPNEVVVLFAFDVYAGETRGSMRLCIPYSSLEPIKSSIELETAPERETVNYADMGNVLRSLLRIPLEVTSVSPSTFVTVRDLMSITKGDVIRLDAKVEDRIYLQVAGKPAFQAAALDVNGHKGAGAIRRCED